MSIRDVRIYGVAVIDLALTAFTAKCIADRFKIPFLEALAYMLLIAVAVHKMFGIDTVLGFYLGFNRRPVTFRDFA